MKRNLLFLFLVCAISASAQIVDSNTYNALAFWNRGEIVRYSAGVYSYDINGQDTIPSLLETYDVSVRVMLKKEDYILLEWIETNPRVYVDTNTDGILAKLHLYLPTVRYIVRTDATGAFLGLDNWKQIGKTNQRLAERLRKNYKKKSNSSKANEIADFIAAYSQTEQGIVENELSFVTDHFCTYFGWQYLLDNKNVMALRVNEGGDSIDTEKIIWLEAIDTTQNIVQIKSMQFYDPQQSTEAAYRALNADSVVVERDKMPTVSIIENHTANIHSSGWPIHSIRIHRCQFANIIDERASYLKIKTNLNK